MPEKSLGRSDAVLLILSVLVGGNRHGYDIAREVERRSGNHLTFNDGTLYPLLHELETRGMIKSHWEGKLGERQKRVYEIQTDGKAELSERMQLWRQYAHSMEQVLEIAA
jgi:DNA-binding PadR family transcriptional regulator